MCFAPEFKDHGLEEGISVQVPTLYIVGRRKVADTYGERLGVHPALDHTHARCERLFIELRAEQL